MTPPGYAGMNSAPMPPNTEGSHEVEKMIEKLGIVAALSERDRIAIAFAIRCAFGMGFIEGQQSRKRAA